MKALGNEFYLGKILSQKLTQITPAYPPLISGVGDYASLLVKPFGMAGYEVGTVVSSFQENLIKPSEGVISLQRLEASALAQLLASSELILLHFSGYGYAQRGLCGWLVDGLQRWKQSHTERRLITIFHEVYASGPFWRSSFWTMLPQRQIARNLAHLSESAFVTSQAGYDQLKELCPSLPLEVLPVFSNVGEPEEVLPLLERDPIAIVFGGSGRRSKTYKAALRNEPLLSKSFDQLGITQVIDIGPADCAPAQLGGRPIQVLGVLSAQDISYWLSQSQLGLMDYPRHVLTKSGIAAAYFAHGMLVLNLSNVGVLPDDLQEGREFLGLAQVADGSYEPQTIASAGLAWYLPHNVENTVKKIIHSLT